MKKLVVIIKDTFYLLYKI